MAPHARTWLPLLVVSLVLAGCMGGGGNAGRSDSGESQTFTKADNGRTVSVAKGATFDVRLESNPSTGYGWTVNGLDATKLRLAQDGQHAAGDCPPGTVGCSGTTTFRFEAIAAGTTPLKLDYAAPGGGTVAESFTLNVTITA